MVGPGDDLVALTASLSAGDSVTIQAGTYLLDTSLRWTGSGTEAAPIVIRGEGNPVIEVASGSYVVALEEASWVRVEGITFQGGAGWDTALTPGNALRLTNVSHVEVVGCELRHVGSAGLYLNGDNSDVLVEGNRIGPLMGDGIYAGCGDASCWTQATTLRRNLVFDLRDPGADGIQLAPGGQGFTIVDNVIWGVPDLGVVLEATEFGEHNVFEGNALWLIGKDGVLVRGPAVLQNNVIFDVVEDGIEVSPYGDYLDQYRDIAVSFNTVAMTGGWGIRAEDVVVSTGTDLWEAREGFVFANNAVVNPLGYGMRFKDGLQAPGPRVVNNVVSGLTEGLTEDEGSVIAGAGWNDFEAPATWDFYPSQGSTLVDAADPDGASFVPAEDFNGLAREGDAPDVGAYEWVQAGNPGWVLQEDFKEDTDPAKVGAGVVEGGCCAENGDPAAAALVLPGLLVGWLGRRRRR